MAKVTSLSGKKGRDGEIDWNSVVLTAKEIVESYDTGVTLRQLYYRLVSTGLIPNKQGAYKMLSAKTAQARREGWFPNLIDRTREIERYAFFDSPQEALESAIATYRRDRTEGQEKSVYIGVEKHGMTVQLMHWFGKLGIPVLALGGYSSQTFVDVVRQHVEKQGRPSVLLYAGDFDPSGMDIDRDFTERGECFDEVYRVALNADLVKKFDLPPMPGKHKDSRSAKFILEHGELVQVELDALAPSDLRKLYQDAIDKHFDKKIWEELVEEETEERDRMRPLESLVDIDKDLDKAIYFMNESLDYDEDDMERFRESASRLVGLEFIDPSDLSDLQERADKLLEIEKELPTLRRKAEAYDKAQSNKRRKS